MTLFFVLSEPLTSRSTRTEPGEPYAICHLVLAKNPSQAKWLAWRTDNASFESDPREMPRFQVLRLKSRLSASPARIVTDELAWQWAWTLVPDRKAAWVRSKALSASA